MSVSNRPSFSGITLVVSTRQRTAATAQRLRHYLRRSGLPRHRIQVLLIENPGTQGLSTLYNQALEQAAFEVVCCLHDDLHFLPRAHWGRQVMAAFRQHQSMAALSAAGSVSLDDTGVFWAVREHLVGQVRHRLPVGYARDQSCARDRRGYKPRAQGRQQDILSAYSAAFAPPHEPLPVMVLDGLFLALCRPRLWHTRPFDESFDFHFYDMAFALQQSVHQPGSCGVLTRLKIVHHSPGTPNDRYWVLRERFVARYGQHLPAFAAPVILPVLSATAIDADAHSDWIWLQVPGVTLAGHQTAMTLQLQLPKAKPEAFPQVGIWAPRLHYADTRLLFHAGLKRTSEGWVHLGMHQPYQYGLTDRPVDAVLAYGLWVRAAVFKAFWASLSPRARRGVRPLTGAHQLMASLDAEYSPQAVHDWALDWGLGLSAQAQGMGYQVRVLGQTWGLWHGDE